MLKWMLRYICRKSTALAAALLYAALAVIGSTYAWITSSDTVVNTMEQSGFFDAAIVETFLPVTGWKPGTQAEKIVSACNAGTYDAVVRMSFEEILRTLDVPAQPYDEPAPSGAVPEHCPAGAYAGWADAADAFAAVVLPAGSPAGLAVKAEPSSAVAGGYRFAAYRALADGNAQRVTADFAVNPAGDTLTVSGVKYWSYGGYSAASAAAWGKASATASPPGPPAAGDAARLITDAGGKITVDYANRVAALTGTAADNGKWFYNEDDGFFYYIGKIGAGDCSPPLMTGLTLGADAGAEYSGLSLTFVVHLEAQQNAAALLGDAWGLASESALYKALENFCG